MYAAPFRPARRASSSRAPLFIVSTLFSFRLFRLSTRPCMSSSLAPDGSAYHPHSPTLLEHCWNTRSVPVGGANPPAGYERRPAASAAGRGQLRGEADRGRGGYGQLGPADEARFSSLSH